MAAALLAASCADAEPRGSDTTPPPDEPTLTPATALPEAPKAAPPEGSTRVRCRMRTDEGPLPFVFDLPDGFRGLRGCLWTRPAPRHTDAPSFPTKVEVTRVDKEGLRSVRARYDELAPGSEDDEFDGDGTIWDLELRTAQPVFGDAVGDVLSYHCYCDGAPDIRYVAEVAGVQLLWTSAPDIRAQTEREFAAALASAGTVRRG